MPFEALGQPAVETDEAVGKRTVFDRHPDPTESLWTLLWAIGIKTVEIAPKEEREAVVKTIEERFSERLPEYHVDYVMKPIRETAEQTRPGRGRR